MDDLRPTSTPESADLDRASPLPLYAQLQRRLQAIIRSGELADGKFYSDQELCARFGVSRYTARQAVQELVSQGLLQRVQGQGTFINTGRFEEIFGPKMDFQHQWAQAGRPLTFELVSFGNQPCPSDMAFLLGLSPGQPVLQIERIRHAGDKIASFDVRFIHPDFAASITAKDAQTQSLLDLLSGRTRLSHAHNRVEAALAGTQLAQRLHVAPTDPVMVRELVYFSHDGLPIMAGRSYSPGNLVRHAFTVSLDPSRQGAPGSAIEAALDLEADS